MLDELSKLSGAVLFKSKVTPRKLFSNYRSKVKYDHGSEGTFGYGSWSYVSRVREYDIKCSLNVGNYSETARGSLILMGGEHENSDILNFSTALWDKYTRGDGQKHGKTKGPVTVGSNVTISTNSIILSGVNIGNGAVIGAGSIVTKDVEPFAIVAGNPARVIRPRFDKQTIEALNAIAWWDFPPPVLFKNAEYVRSIPEPSAVRHLEKIKAKKSNNFLRFISKGDPARDTWEFIGVEMGGKFTARNDLPKPFLHYITQINLVGDELKILVDDIFELLS